MSVRKGCIYAAIAGVIFVGVALLREWLHPETIAGWPAVLLLMGSIVGIIMCGIVGIGYLRSKGR